MLLSTFWKCSAALFPKDLTVFSSTALPTGLPKLLQKPKNSGKAKKSAEIGQITVHIATIKAIAEPRKLLAPGKRT
jgi:hypothetical protein